MWIAHRQFYYSFKELKLIKEMMDAEVEEMGCYGSAGCDVP